MFFSNFLIKHLNSIRLTWILCRAPDTAHWRDRGQRLTSDLAHSSHSRRLASSRAGGEAESWRFPELRSRMLLLFFGGGADSETDHSRCLMLY